MNWVLMSLQICLNGCLIFTLIAGISFLAVNWLLMSVEIWFLSKGSFTFSTVILLLNMFCSHMNSHTTLFSCLIIAIFTLYQILHSFMCWLYMFCQRILSCEKLGTFCTKQFQDFMLGLDMCSEVNLLSCLVITKVTSFLLIFMNWVCVFSESTSVGKMFSTYITFKIYAIMDGVIIMNYYEFWDPFSI